MANGQRPSPGACNEAFRYWLFSFPFFLDFRLGGFDVLPDVVGFFLVVLGCWRLGRFHRLLPQIQTLAGVLGAVSLADIYEPSGPTGIVGPISAIPIIVGLALAAMMGLLVWWMCQVVADFARRVGASSIIQAAELRRMLFVGWQAAVIATIGITVITNAGEAMSIFVIALFFAGIAVVGLLMELMMHARQLCGGKDPHPAAAPAPQPAPEARPTPG